MNMTVGSPCDMLASSLYSATLKDLAPYEYRQFTPSMKREGKSPEDAPMGSRRPQPEECDVVMFPQVWGSTALGFDGVGGAAITKAYTVIVIGPAGDACVYFSGRLAYKAQSLNPAFMADMAARNMSAVFDSAKYLTGVV